MVQFTSYTTETAPAAARPVFEKIEGAFGFVPNLQSYMAESPELLAGYTALLEEFSRSSFTAHEQQVVYFSANFENDCRYCMAGHTAMAKMQEMEPAVINALRAGEPLPDARLEALHRFATLVVRNRGWVDEADVDAFIASGFTKRNVLEVVLGVAMKAITHYTSQITQTPLDDFMKGNEWSKPVMGGS
jgi:AhpD family alkylhydroperoxidase